MPKFVGLVLTLGVAFVNGFTDAPTSTATAVCSGALKLRSATFLCAVFNFLGVMLASLLNTKIARVVFSLNSGSRESVLALASTLICVIFFGILCYLLALPSSESHALICASIGASFFLSNDVSGIKNTIYVFVFMLFSNAVAFLASYASRRILPSHLPFKRLQIASCAASSYMHGWQDGQKLIGVALVSAVSTFEIPFWLIFSVSIAISLGSLLGGNRIINTLGRELTSLNDFSAFCSDLGSYVTLLVFSIFGIPLSTGNVKSLAIVGAGLADSQKINKKATARILLVSAATFPACFLLGYLIMSILCFIF